MMAKKHRRKWVKAAAAATGTVVVAVVSGLAGSYLGIASERDQWPFSAPSARDAAEDLDGVFPTTECKANYATVFTGAIRRSDGSLVATVELRHGSDCGASWVWVRSSVADVVVEKTLSRDENNDVPAITVEENDTIASATGPERESYTEQVYSPECVTFSVVVREVATGAVLGAVPDTRICTDA
ncbi:hypothetical protein L332_00050 [Agrococcus pavilionensis RW1]|uniref:DUF2690 domain-containing protein n=1 Tax=Agrococcus pavilionensis RW1 TaxID=1330458 RepID=U1MLW9_9MICO|nr:hypothetical protein [Agrococcus pavilionensis]ERG62861.1 hypothetical protein L332_00050 [Agrococcus pavilionensis RW1]